MNHKLLMKLINNKNKKYLRVSFYLSNSPEYKILKHA